MNNRYNSKVFSIIKIMILFKLLFFCLLTNFSYGSKLLIIDNIEKNVSIETQQIITACRFYGINFETIFAKGDKTIYPIINQFKFKEIGAIVITGNALRYIDGKELSKIINIVETLEVPILITDITESLKSEYAKVLTSNMQIRNYNNFSDGDEVILKVSNLHNIALELAGQNFFYTGQNIKSAYGVKIINNSGWEALINIQCTENNLKFPIFVKSTSDHIEIFIHSRFHLKRQYLSENSFSYNYDNFITIAPLLMFLRYAFGEHCWHNPSDYANLTIDDPWLYEPYGFLEFKGLLKKMRSLNFHTTIAFIPWNFDRNNEEIVTLFKENQDRFSLCVHGCDHEHREFGKYAVDFCDATSVKTFRRHEVKIRTAVARMEKMRILTGLPYDRVMVFPHGIAPSPTLGLLKKYNFIATSNLSNIPLGSEKPIDPVFNLKTITTHFENFPSLKRYIPIAEKSTTTQSKISIDLFLDNPVLFYTHHNFFKDGIDAFNKTAEVVNDIEPNVKWRSLGYIAQHCYLKRLRDDGNYDILAYTSNFILENRKQHTITYFIRKEESFCPSIKEIVVDGLRHSYERYSNYLTIKLVIPPREYRHIVIEYKNDLDLDSVEISKGDLRVAMLRWLSDFRDLILSRNVLGRFIVSFYYKLGGKGLLATFIAATGFVFLGVFYFRRKNRI